jgi:hypothetical protein
MMSALSAKPRRVFRISVFLAAVAFPIALLDCISDQDVAPTRNACPSTTNFRLVSQVYERRCGTLDCHGQSVRPFRIYGRDGLRKPDKGQGGGYVSGGMLPTTDAEVDANYHSACGLEPERMANVVAGNQPVDSLTLVRKPRLTEAHKGGMVLPEGSAGDKCVTSWIRGNVNTDACLAELQKP